MLYLRWVADTPLVAFFVLLVGCNVAYVLNWFLHQKHSSLVIIIGGVGLVGFLILPIKLLNDWFWLPPIADLDIPYGVLLILLAGRLLWGQSTSREAD